MIDHIVTTKGTNGWFIAACSCGWTAPRKVHGWSTARAAGLAHAAAERGPTT